jgi:3-oxo-5-alpha-steroid 4-dehydrogenase 1
MQRGVPLIAESDFFQVLLRAWFALAVVMFVVLLRLPAPYGRHASSNWGATLSARTGWLLMEAPASILLLAWFLTSSHPAGTVSIIFLLMWEAHYVHRAFVYPFTLGKTARPMPVVVVLFGILFNVVNTYLNGRYLFVFSPVYSSSWLSDPRFIVGTLVFCAGYVLNRYSDYALRRERLATGVRYCRMERGIFRYICCPNYLGEILIWSGWAFATWSLAGLSFAVWTAANLLPRARAHLKWCRLHFEDYPSERKSVVPGIW